MKIYNSYVEVAIIGAKTCYQSIVPITYFALITLFCSDSLFYRLLVHKALSYFETFDPARVNGQLSLIPHIVKQTIDLPANVIYKTIIAPRRTAKWCKTLK